MVPSNVITAWAIDHPWPTRTQVEQDLIISQAICQIANHPYLGNELVFRGGTALNKLHMPQPRRYSEDLDYVRSTAGAIGPMTTALRELGEHLGFTVRTSISTFPKVYWLTSATDGTRLRIKIEVNTRERISALGTKRLPFQVKTAWWTGQADVPTFHVAELMATKVRALYQRSKGRDAFDLWLALTELHTSPSDIIAAFELYRPEGWTSILAERNLRAKLRSPQFLGDISELVTTVPSGFTPEVAVELITSTLFHHM